MKINNITLWATAFTVVLLFLGSCKQEHADHTASTEVYTCPMHPDVEQAAPGKCPICGMELVKKSVAAPFNGLMLSDSQVRLANVTTRTAGLQEIGQSIILNARLTVDEDRSKVVSSRVGGRVERLYVKETGRNLQAGEPFMELYSETMQTLQQEYLLALDQAGQVSGAKERYAQFVLSARQKLLRYGLSEKQIDELARSKKVSDRVVFFAPLGGLVTNISVSEGQYLEEGTPLYRVEDIRHIWVEAEVYPGEAEKIKTGDAVTVKIAGFEDKPLNALVTFVTPEYRENSQLTIVRTAVENNAMIFQPGMQAQVFLRHSTRKALALPVDAVIRGGSGAFAYVMTNKNTFERRRVVTGMEDMDLVEITAGLKEGEQVVVSGAYLLHSEMILKGQGEKHIH
jgi:membrane fusion protein, copper/silver efflux system